MDGFALAEHVRRRSELNAVTIMMLTSGGHKDDLARCHALGLAAYLWKPIGELQLRETLVRVVAGRNEDNMTDAITPPFEEGEKAAAAQLRVLVAEDNPVNQLVVKRLLQKRGHVVAVAANGKTALEILEQERFDLVLMDIQMPVMGGVEATAAIRKQEQHSGRHLPIIALTANAMKGDREKYLASGMDDYLSKPIHREELDALLEKYTAKPLIPIQDSLLSSG
jgi:two-component system, sensor histidine kinase and response regulator